MARAIRNTQIWSTPATEKLMTIAPLRENSFQIFAKHSRTTNTSILSTKSGQYCQFQQMGNICCGEVDLKEHDRRLSHAKKKELERETRKNERNLRRNSNRSVSMPIFRLQAFSNTLQAYCL